MSSMLISRTRTDDPDELARWHSPATEGEMTTICKPSRRPTAPGEILAELYLTPRRVPIAKFAEACGLTRKHMSAIVNGRAAITAETATRIAAVLGTTAHYWLNL